MEPIRPLWNEMPLTRFSEKKPEKLWDEKGFVSIFRSAIDAVKETNADKVQLETLMATGELDNPSTLIIAQQKELQATQLLVTLRNSAVDAYNELMRINL